MLKKKYSHLLVYDLRITTKELNNKILYLQLKRTFIYLKLHITSINKLPVYNNQ